MMTIEKEFPLLEEILGAWREKIGIDFEAYRNHLYRMIHYCFAQRDCSPEEREKIIIAACFHDIGIWSDGTLDYLPPSEMRAEEYLRATGRQAWIPEIIRMIELHHRLQSCADDPSPLVEVFRRADIADFSMGFVRIGISRDVIRQVKGAFPNAGFHKRLLQMGTPWVLRNPLNPIPFLRC